MLAAPVAGAHLQSSIRTGAAYRCQVHGRRANPVAHLNLPSILSQSPRPGDINNTSQARTPEPGDLRVLTRAADAAVNRPESAGRAGPPLCRHVL
jgi:hypothetical protein